MIEKIVLQENKGNYLSDTPKKRFNIWRWLTGPSLNEIISNAIEDKRIYYAPNVDVFSEVRDLIINMKMGKPFTTEEQEVMDLLVQAHNKFIALPPEYSHPNERHEWHLSFHRLQSLLGGRALIRLYPDYFTKTKQDDSASKL